MAKSSKSSKRKLDNVIDLTGSDDDAGPQPKTARISSNGRVGPIQVVDEDDEDYDGTNELVSFTQSVDDDGVAAIHVGTIGTSSPDGKVVGIQYYDGYACKGESVLVRREPSNRYDRNAIRIDNVQGNQIGHIPRTIAAKLAPFMDDRSLLVEGVLSGDKGTYDCPISLRLYGNSDPTAKLELEKKMKDAKLPLSKQKRVPKSKEESIASQRKKLGMKGNQNAGISGTQTEPEINDTTIQDLMQASERYRPRSIDELAHAWGTPEQMLESLPMIEQPNALEATLLPYQLQGLAWMLKMEKPTLPSNGSKDIVQLWRRSEARADLFSNVATNYTTQQPPALSKGGILADDMGLGKTIQCISLITCGGPGTTLIVAPVSVMSNWSQQIEHHVKKDRALKVLVYHGSSRKKNMAPAEFKAYDVVITAYGTLSSELEMNGKEPASEPSSRRRGLFGVDWNRIILDEGHIIRNPSTKVAVAACNVSAKSRWVLSGTPIVNTIKDLYSMLKFLRVTGGLEKLDIFNAILTRPLAAGSPDAETLLQTIMQNMVLRRRKEMKFVDLKLPELSEYVRKIEFRQDEREKYQALQSEAQGMLQKYQDRMADRTGKTRGEYQHLLEILLRLRQICCHWKLCGEDRISNLMKLLDAEKVLELTDENRVALQILLALSAENSEECPICLEDLHNPVITTCKHIFGLECITRVIEGQRKCPMCRNPLQDTEQLVHPHVEADQDSKDEDIDVDTKSSKTEALMEILKASRKDPDSKVIIFSQWTSFLNIIQRQITEAGYAYTRLDGSMKAPARDAAIKALETEPDTKIMLASLAVCSVGLNLVMADTVILADSWWAPSIEDQAIDRVHRLGQTRKTTVWRLIMENSIEERVLDIQAEKRKLVGQAFREKGREAGKQNRIGDLQKLLR